MRIRVAIERGIPAANYFHMARKLITDADNDCRWQALIIVGESITKDPGEVWQVIEEYGSADDRDLRTGVATVLLEHLLEQHFEQFYRPVIRRVLAGDELFADALETCWVSVPESPSRRRLQHLLDAAKRGLRRLE